MKMYFSTDDKRSVGFLGFVLFVAFFFLCVVQMCRQHESGYNLRLNSQLIFLAISSLGATCDAMYFFLMMVHDNYTTVGYVFHMLAMFAFAMSFIVVVLRWNRAMQTGSHSSSAVLGATYLLVAANVVVTLIAVIESSRVNNYEKYIEQWSYEAVAVLNCTTIFIYCLGLFFYAQYVRSKLVVSGIRTVQSSSVSTSTSSSANTSHVYSFAHNSHRAAVVLQDSGEGQAALMKKLRKMHLVLGLCSMCYCFRVVCLAFVTVDYERGETSTDSVSLVLWFTLSLWIPSLGSGLILLYTMRPAIKNSAPSRHRRQLRSSAHPSSASSATLLPSHESASDDDSDDDDCSSRSRLNTVPLLSEDYGDDLATRYEATVQQARYREESLSTGTFKEYDFTET